MKAARTIVVIGATGHFGGRICRRLIDEPGVELVVTSRGLPQAEILAGKLRGLPAMASVRAASLDHSSADFEKALRELHPDIVIHTAGPFQGQDYRVARACIACRCHYLDLADGRQFVEGFSALHRDALDRDILLVSGASTLPGLSSAVVEHAKDRFRQIETIATSIAPAHQTPRGAGTIAAVLSYCGKPFEVLVDGAWVTMHGWQNLRRQRYKGLGKRLSGACDVPDLGLFPGHVQGLKTATFHAALEAPWEQLALWSMACLTRARLVRDWTRLAPAFEKLSGRLVRLGSNCGGMRIVLSGTGRQDDAITLGWMLLAGQNHGPEVPCSPALILARKLLAGDIERRGALPCLGLITMADFDAEVSAFDIRWTIDDGH